MPKSAYLGDNAALKMASPARAKELIAAISASLPEGELEHIKLELLAIFETAVVPAEIVDAPHSPLSRRENEVMSMILVGKRLKEIAATLDISVKTVTTHRSRLLRKLSLDDNLGLYRYGIRNGLIRL
ncbi:MAG: LuxR C-terminal-related transcriptional regulator [Acidobacteriota bacterium]